MTIEITGVGTANKGAELMLLAIIQHFDRYEEIKLVVDRWFGTYEDRSKYGLLYKEDVVEWGRARLAMSIMPSGMKRVLGIISDQEVDVLLDASGFAFGDEHPFDRIKSFADKIEKAKRQGKIIIVLPQAFGPFKRKHIRQQFERILDSVDLIFARDEMSMSHVRACGLETKDIHLAPDFTNQIRPDYSSDTKKGHGIYFVPNHRMIEKASSEEEANQYLDLLIRSIDIVRKKGLSPILLAHSQPDLEIVKDISLRIGKDVETIVEHDPLKIKEVLGTAQLVVASRFHALVSSLSQNVPVVATSWSHKYEMLLEQYGCPDLMLQIPSTEQAIYDRIEKALGAQSNGLQQKIAKRNEILNNEVNKMWKAVDEVIGL